MYKSLGVCAVLAQTFLVIIAVQPNFSSAEAQTASQQIQVVPSQAETPTPTPDPDYDYGNASAYAEAKHKIIKDNRLGKENNKNDGFTFDSGQTGAAGTNQSVNFKVNNKKHIRDHVTGWIDFNQNNIFEDSESLFSPISVWYKKGDQSKSFVFSIPEDAKCGSTWARFRLGDDILGPTGQHESGEVEDYSYEITDCLTEVTLSGSGSMSENDGSVTLTASITEATNQDIVIFLKYSGSATYSSDYLANSSITILQGETEKTITISSMNDSTYEGNEFILVEIDSMINGREIVEQEAIFSIVEDDINDTDGDGVPDTTDIDDDNDGITDLIECGDVGALNLLNGSFEQPSIGTGSSNESNVSGWNSSGGSLELWQSGNNSIPSANQAQHLALTSGETVYQDFATPPGSTIIWNFAHAGKGGIDVLNVQFGSPSGIYSSVGQFYSGQFSWAIYNGAYKVPAGQTTTRIRFVALNAGSGINAIGSFIDAIELDQCNLDTDEDGILDKLDLDSDNDGIPDNVEAQTTDGYLSPTGIDSNNNGLDNSYELSGLAPVDSDFDTVADFIDHDSDNDGLTDFLESGLSPSSDSNGDGIGDGVGASFSDVNGQVNTPSTDLLDTDSDATLGEDVDYRDTEFNGRSCQEITNFDVLFLVDNSGSISDQEFSDFSNSIQTVGDLLLASNSKARVGVAHFGGPEIYEYEEFGRHILIERDFSRDPISPPVRIFSRGAYSDWYMDNMAGGLEELYLTLDGSSLTSSSKNVGSVAEMSHITGDAGHVVIFTDAAWDYLGDSAIRDMNGPSGDWSIYDTYKNNGFRISLIRVQFLSNIDQVAAVASTGGGYFGAVAPNPNDPDGSGVSPRLLYTSADFDFTSLTDGIISGINSACLGAVDGVVWDDANFDGIRQNGEARLSNIPVRLYDHNDTLLAQVLTENDGSYAFAAEILEDIDAGFRIEFIRPNDTFIFSVKDSGSDDTIDSDADSITGRTDLFISIDTQNIDAGLFTANLDHGDAPASYGSSYAAVPQSYDAAWIGGITDRPDTEDPFTDEAGAVADNQDGIDDEQGVSFLESERNSDIAWFLDTIYQLEVTVYNPEVEDTFLEAWVDFNGNGTFDDQELILSRTIPKNVEVQTIAPINVLAPLDASCGLTYARFRLSDHPMTNPYGYAGLGETEDYPIIIDCQTDLEIELGISPGPVIKTGQSYSSELELSEIVYIDAFVVNHGPNPARNMTTTVSFPAGLTHTSIQPASGWSCNITGELAECTKNGLNIGFRERFLTYTGRVPGTFPRDTALGIGIVTHEAIDPYLQNNQVDYTLEIDKTWKGGTAAFTPFVFVEFDDALEISTADKRDFEENEIVLNPIQIPIEYAVGLQVTTLPTITTGYCTLNEGAVGCDLASDIITGTVAVKSYTTISVTEMVRIATQYQPVGSNLITSTVTVGVAGSATERYTESIYDDCAYWQSHLGGKCVAPYDIFSSYSTVEQAPYRWQTENLTPIVFETSGGRLIECTGNCIDIHHSKPGVYYVEGIVTFDVVFIDPPFSRLGDDPSRFESTTPFGFYLKIVAPFVEKD